MAKPNGTTKEVTKSLKTFVVKEISEKKRSHTFTGKVIHAEDYVTSNKGLPGISFEVEGMPYRLRVLKGSLKGGSKASHFLDCKVTFTGGEREHEGKVYFDPKDAKIVEYSQLAKFAATGAAFAGSLL